MRYAIGGLRVDPKTRTVLVNGAPVAVGMRVVAILIALCERAPAVVSKDELIAQAWPGSVVDDSSLWQNIHVIRQLLRAHAGTNAIENVRGRGYRLTVPVRISRPPAREILQRGFAAVLAIALVCSIGGRPVIPARSEQARRIERLAAYYWNLRTEPALRQSLLLYRQLTRLEPKNATGYAGIADSAAILSLFYDDDYVAYRRAALRASATALAVDPNSAASETSYALAREVAFQHYGIYDDYFLRAISLDPSYAPARLRYGISLVARGRISDAIVQLRRAVDLEPVSLPANLWLARALYYAHRPGDAVAYAREAVRLAPDQWDAQMLLGNIEAALGDKHTAAKTFVALVPVAPRLARLLLVQLNAASGAQKIARKQLARESLYDRDDAILWENAAIAQLQLRDRTAALAALRHIHNADATDRAVFALDPRLDVVRDDARFMRWTAVPGS